VGLLHPNYKKPEFKWAKKEEVEEERGMVTVCLWMKVAKRLDAECGVARLEERRAQDR
jgi:hypothetical protein